MRKLRMDFSSDVVCDIICINASAIQVLCNNGAKIFFTFDFFLRWQFYKYSSDFSVGL